MGSRRVTGQGTVIAADWDRDRESLRAIRHEVFVVEQGVDPQLEWDGKDARCAHALALSATGRPIATGRLAADGKIGRMAVVRRHRGSGVGGDILKALIDIAKSHGLSQVYLHAQSHALRFYERHGFEASGAEFDEAGIPHRRMTRDLERPKETRT